MRRALVFPAALVVAGPAFADGFYVGGTSTYPFVTISPDGGNATFGSLNDAANANVGGTAMAIFRQLHLDAVAPAPIAASPAVGGINVSTGVVRVPSSGANQVLTAVKASAGRVYKITGFNTSGGPRNIKFYNAAAANVTPGTTVPVLVKYLPAGAAFSYDVADIGWYFSTAISFSISQQPQDNDTTGVAAGDIVSLSVEFQ